MSQEQQRVAGDVFDWLRPMVECEEPQLRLFCFPHAGGGTHAYIKWPAALPSWVEVVAISPPGRGSRMRESPVGSLSLMTSSIVEAIKPRTDVPFVFFGHSLGSIVAYEVARLLECESLPTPALLLASAHAPPALSSCEESTWLHGLSDADFVDGAASRGFIPAEALGDPDVLAVLLPALRADLAIHETLDPSGDWASTPAISCDVIALGGADDDFVSAASLAQWSNVTSAGNTAKEPRLFAGGHFYLESDQSFLPFIREQLQHVMGVLPLSVLNGAQEPRFTFGKCAHELFDMQADRTPDRLAIIGEHRQLTFCQVKDESNMLAALLQQQGVRRGSIVGSYMPHCAEYILANLAIFKAGAAIFPLETNYPSDLIEELVEMAGIQSILTIASMRGNLPAAFRDDAGGRSFCVEGAWVEQLCQLDLSGLSTTEVGLDDIAYVTMTSGSTGKPKGVVNTHLGAVCNFLPRFEILPYTDDPIEVEGLNVFFAWECLRPLLCGVTACIIPDELILDPKKLVNFIEARGITRLMTTTQLLEAILEHPGLDLETKLQKIHFWLLEGEPVPDRVVDKWLSRICGGGVLVNVYSTWESLDISYAQLTQSVAHSKFAPVGDIMPNVSVYLLDADLKLVPRGSVGEIFVASPGLAIEYLGDPVKTADKFLMLDLEGQQVRVYRSGDRGRILSDGQLECMGRKDSTVKIRGFKVSIPLVEAVIKDSALIAQAAVMPIIDERSNVAESLVAYVVGPDGRMSDEDVQQLKSDLKSQLPSFSFPAHWMTLDKMPVKGGESRKLDRLALPKFEQKQQPSPSKGTGGTAASRLEEVMINCWSELLGVSSIAVTDNFFEVGGHSLLAAKLIGVLTSKYGLNCAVLDLYDNPTIESLARHLDKSDVPVVVERVSSRASSSPPSTESLAIVGMAGRFPSTPNLSAFWEVLKSGKDTLRRFTAEELSAKNVPADVLRHADYVLAGQVCDDVDKFDAAFFGIGKLEAEIMDPQHRVFMEVAWEAVENAGYGPRTTMPKNTGVFAASGIDGYLVHHLDGGALKTPMEPSSLFMTEVGSEKDYIATRVSYVMDLHGPSINVQSACSSGLVAIAQAAQSMLAGACDLAIAGASSLTFPNTGFLFEESLVYSIDGHVRPFDSKAGGTTFGDSVGAVVLKLLVDAVEDGDNILALLEGSAITNDGGVKAGYTAPTAAGQARAIVAAQQAAGITARDISYVECHATATNIGDAIEIRGLNEAFQKTTDDKNFCAIGSIKGNIGHANCAAGLTGFIKTVLCLHHRKLVPTAHFQQLNNKIPLRNSPFFVHEGLSDWLADGEQIRSPLRAGVSSFGIGGTNAHAILREWEPAEREKQLTRGHQGRQWQLLTVSAKSEQSLKDGLSQLATSLGQDPVLDLTDVAYTLHCGRDQFVHRATVTCQDSSTAVEALRSVSATKAEPNPSIVLCFPGQGSQYIGMGQDLYDAEPIYRSTFDDCCAVLQPLIQCDLRAKLFVPFGATSEQTEDLSQALNSDAVLVQTSMFAVEYSMARLLIDCVGLAPIALVGHSIGEYAAAVVSGILQLGDALGMVVTRATAMRDLCGKAGESGMLSARMPIDEARKFAAEKEDLWIACENTPTNVVFSGSASVLKAAKAELAQREIRSTALHVSHGFHSPLVQPAADAVLAYAKSLPMSAPTIPMTSNVTGKWLDPDDVSPQYWSKQIVNSVRFVENIQAVSMWKPTILVECGPGNTLCTLVGKCYQNHPHPATTCQSMRHATATGMSDQRMLSEFLGKLWGHGIAINWKTYHQGERCLRTPLPGYAFERTSFWINPSASIYTDKSSSSGGGKKASTTRKKPVPTGPESPALVYYQPRKPEIKFKVYCLPYAGGSSQVFAAWARSSAQWLDVVAVEPPGRGARASEPHPSSDSEDANESRLIAEAIRLDFAASSATHAALVGFSMGVLAAIELSQLLKDLPIVHGFLAGRAPPIRSVDTDAAGTSVDISGLNLAPNEVVESEEWSTYFLPMLTADLAADARAQQRLAHCLPSVPFGVSIFCGLEDSSFPWQDTPLWRKILSDQDHDSVKFDEHFFSGGHDFLKNSADVIFSRVESDLAGSAMNAHTAESVTGITTHDTPASILNTVNWERIDAAGTSPSAHTLDECVVLPVCAGEAMKVTDTHMTAVSSPMGLIVALGGDPTVNLEPGLEDDIEQCAMLLDVVKQLLEKGAAGKLIVVSCAEVKGAIANGLSKVVPLEWPELTVQRVFIKNDTAQTMQDIWPRAAHYAQLHPAEADISLHFKKRRSEPVIFAPRLRAMAVDAMASSLHLGLASNADDTYIVSGGMGGVGSAVVDWLIDAQSLDPSQIVVLTRRKVEAPHPRGAQIVTADVSNTDTLLSCPALQALDSVAGIFHLAGVLDDGVLTDMTRARIAKTMAPKATGALNLQQLAQRHGWEPDWLLCFSSTSSLGGYPGQANYCAANAVLDQLAQWGDGAAAGMPIIAINWGPWGEAGMAAVGTKAHQLSLENGEIPLTNAQGLSCLASVLFQLEADNAPRQFAACNCDWPRTPWHGMSLLTHVAASDDSDDEQDAPATVGDDGEGTTAESEVVAFLKDRVPRWDMSQQLAALGLDSLDVVATRNGFNKHFKSRLDGTILKMEVFSPNKTLAALVQELEAALT